MLIYRNNFAIFRDLNLSSRVSRQLWAERSSKRLLLRLANTHSYTGHMIHYQHLSHLEAASRTCVCKQANMAGPRTSYAAIMSSTLLMIILDMQHGSSLLAYTRRAPFWHVLCEDVSSILELILFCNTASKSRLLGCAKPPTSRYRS